MRRRRRWRDEEEFSRVGKIEMCVFWRDGCRLTEIYAHLFAHYFFAVEDLTDADGGFFGEEGDDDAGEGF